MSACGQCIAAGELTLHGGGDIMRRDRIVCGLAGSSQRLNEGAGTVGVRETEESRERWWVWAIGVNCRGEASWRCGLEVVKFAASSGTLMAPGSLRLLFSLAAPSTRPAATSPPAANFGFCPRAQ